MPRARSAPVPRRSSASLPFGPLRSFLESWIEDGRIPGAVVAIGRSGGLTHLEALGRRAIEPRSERMTVRTIFDLASLTKPMVTAPLMVGLALEGRLDLESGVERYLEEMRGSVAGSIQLHMLLTHTGGFPAINAAGDYGGDKTRLYAAIAREPLEARPGERFQYSDVGYIVLQGVVERVVGTRLDRAAQERIFGPLRFRDTRYGTGAQDRSRAAPTEREHGAKGPWLRGRVHDPRARTKALGGIGGHAGIFGTAEEVARYCAMLLRAGMVGRRRILAEETVRLMTTNRLDPGLGVRRGYGFDIESPYSAPRGSLFSRDSYGHSGYTGVSMWIDPRNDAYFVLLTNSLHAGGHKDLKSFRSEAATLAARGLGIRG